MQITADQLDRALGALDVDRDEVTVHSNGGLSIDFDDQRQVASFWTKMNRVGLNTAQITELINGAETEEDDDGAITLTFPGITVSGSLNGDTPTPAATNVAGVDVAELERKVNRLCDLANTRFGVRI